MSRIETIGNATLYFGDCREILPLLPKVDVAVTDPPYGFGAYETDNDEPVIETLSPFQRKAVFGFPEVLCRWCAQWGQPSEWVTWWPTNKQCGRTAGLSRESEAIAIFGKLCELPFRPRIQDAMTLKIHESRNNSLSQCKDGDVWRDPAPGIAFNGHLRCHPNEKPITLMARLLRLTSNADEIILDPFMGSGTTGISALNTGRKFIGIEIEEKYFDIACRRIDEARRQGDLFIESKEDAVAAAMPELLL